MVTTANLFYTHGHTVTLVILDETTSSFYPILGGIQIIQQPLSFGITPEGNIFSRKIKLLSDVLKLRRIIKTVKADTIIATEYPFAVAAILTGSSNKTKLIAWEHHHLHELPKNFFWEKMCTLSYPGLYAVVSLNEDEKKLFEKFNNNIVVIPNFIFPATTRPNLTSKKILTVARLTPVKGTDLLLQAATLVFQKHPDWRWTIIGDGDMKDQSLQFIKEEKLEQNLLLSPPVTHELEREYLGSSIYACTSRHESFGMTIIEAMNAGIPVVSFDCETGPRHIITNNEDGFLIEKENPAKLAEAISSLITNEDLRKKMGKKAFQNVQRFSPERIYELWRNLF